jgi:Fe(3+) dicitrate transport protein
MQPTRLTPLARTLRQLLLGASLSFGVLPLVHAADAKPYHIVLAGERTEPIRP